MSPHSREEPRTDRIALLAIVGISIITFGFGNALLELVHRWSTQEEYSHGFIIPFLAAWLLWTRRHELRSAIDKPTWAGPAVILLAMSMHIVGEISAIVILSQLGFILALVGLILAVGGYRLLKASFAPITLLLFAIPLPYFIDSKLSFQLQLISSELGTFFIRLFHIPVVRDGNIIDLGYYKLQVVEACSGLRYLYPLLSLSFLIAYLFNAPLWQRAVLFLSSIPLTIAMNGIRIGLVGVTVNRWGPHAADNVLHLFEGWVIFIACGAALALEIKLLSRRSGRSFLDAFHLPRGSPKLPQTYERKVGGPLLASLLLLVVTAVTASHISGRSEFIPDRPSFVAFPARIGGWQGHTTLIETEVERGLVGLDDYLLSDYQRLDGKTINLYVAYYSSQRKGESPHSPIVCLPGGGWQITDFKAANYTEEGTAFPINRVIIEKNFVRQIVYYWFDERGRKISNEFLAKWYLFADAIAMNRTDGALVRLTTRIHDGETERDADERLQEFMRGAVPVLATYLPSQTASKSASPRGFKFTRS